MRVHREDLVSFSKFGTFIITILKLAIDACKEGQCATTRVNASNEVAVEAFLEGKIQFCDIAKVNDATLNAMPYVSVNSIQQILEQDSLARTKANEIIRGKFQC